MRHCIIADFEWCVTPHPHASRFQYFNEIVSAAAVRIDESGTVLDSFYTLIRPISPDYVHPVILDSLKLDRKALADAPSFDAFFAQFRAFCGMSEGMPPSAPIPAVVCTWGSADRAALLQNLRIKGGFTGDDAVRAIPPMRDLQPALCRAAELKQPYPSLASLLHTLHLDSRSDNRHNALSDALDTARITSHFAGKEETRATVLPLYFRVDGADTPPITSDIQNDISASTFRTPNDALQNLRTARIPCPVCGSCIGCGTWFRASQKELLSVCSCELDGKFLCSVCAERITSPDDPTPLYIARREILPYLDTQKKRYEEARRNVRAVRKRTGGGNC